MGGRTSWIVRGLASFSAAVTLLGAALPPGDAGAFCGFYVGGADKKLFNNATVVVLMREGTRTVLSMQNNYQGPPEAFAMVVPVPVVLQKENVKTLPREVFDRVDQLAAPRLVEYWEQDPCNQARYAAEAKGGARPASPAPAATAAASAGYGVKIEAQFTVGEYEIVILSAEDSTGLDRWLKDSGYKIPEGAEPLLRPYVQSGSKFFVAKVDVTKVKMEKGQAMLSPLRFHYDAESFSLPVRLGLANSSGTQDLLVHVLARHKRYELANYKNVTIPTNIDIDEKAKDQFPAFYAALFDRTLEENMDSDKRPPVVTEYSWDAGSCDPCPGPVLDSNDLATLGADVLHGAAPAGSAAPSSVAVSPTANPWAFSGGFVVTRLHARYKKDQIGEDLVFKVAEPITGGREVYGQSGASRERTLETGATKGHVNNFQGRYAIRHPWKGPIECANPKRGVWGGPPGGQHGGSGAKAARDLAFAPRGGVELASLVKHDVPEIGLKAQAATVVSPGSPPLPSVAGGQGCGCRVPAEQDGAAGGGALAALLAALGLAGRRRRARAARLTK
jgi:MYXO-CTERM domain-containing protein